LAAILIDNRDRRKVERADFFYTFDAPDVGQVGAVNFARADKEVGRFFVDDEIGVQFLDVLSVAVAQTLGQRGDESTRVVMSAITMLKRKNRPRFRHISL